MGRDVRLRPSKAKSDFSFTKIFSDLILCFKIEFGDEKEVFRNLAQNKSCSKFYSLQLSYRALFKILNRF
jgi:hypothetical protein